MINIPGIPDDPHDIAAEEDAVLIGLVRLAYIEDWTLSRLNIVLAHVFDGDLEPMTLKEAADIAHVEFGLKDRMLEPGAPAPGWEDDHEIGTGRRVIALHLMLAGDAEGLAGVLADLPEDDAEAIARDYLYCDLPGISPEEGDAFFFHLAARPDFRALFDAQVTQAAQVLAEAGQLPPGLEDLLAKAAALTPAEG